MSAPKMDTRWWVTITTTEGKTTRHPFEVRDNALKFMVDCRDAGCLAELTQPRDPARPWEVLS